MNFGPPFGKHSCSLPPSWNGGLLAEVGWLCLYSKRKAEIHFLHPKRVNFGPPFGKTACSLSPSWTGSLLAKVGWFCFYSERKAEIHFFHPKKGILDLRLANIHVLYPRAGMVACLQGSAGFAFTNGRPKLTSLPGKKWILDFRLAKIHVLYHRAGMVACLQRSAGFALTVNGKPKFTFFTTKKEFWTSVWQRVMFFITELVW